jgi:hypothetical protein
MTREHVTQSTMVCLVMALAIWEAGPHEPGDWRLSAVLGAQQNPPVMALCNGLELVTVQCPVALDDGRSCGPDYRTSRPVASGKVVDKLFDYDRVVCNRRPPPYCPQIMDMKHVNQPCQPRVVP